MKRNKLRKFLCSYNALAAALLLVVFHPDAIPVGLRTDMSSLAGRSAVARILDVPWADQRLGTLRLDGAAVGSGRCHGWVCESEISRDPSGQYPAVLLRFTQHGMGYPLSNCTGTLLADRVTVVTAAHCLAGRVEKIKVSAFRDENVSVKAVSYRLHRTWTPGARRDADGVDIAVVTLASPLFGVPTAIVGNEVSGPLEIWGIQYPEDRDPRMHRCRPSFDDVTVENFRDRGLTVLVPCDLRPGASGGPVYSGTGEDRRLVAVVVAVDKDGNNYVDPVGDLEKDYGSSVVLTSR